MLSSRNLLNPANGKTIVFPSQDMVLGINFLTRHKPSAKGEGKRYSSPEEVVMACESKACDYEALIRVPIAKRPVWNGVGKPIEAAPGEPVTTTAGRLILNEALPADVPYINFRDGRQGTPRPDRIHLQD